MKWNFDYSARSADEAKDKLKETKNLPGTVRNLIEMTIDDFVAPVDPDQLLHVESEGDLGAERAYCNFAIEWEPPA